MSSLRIANGIVYDPANGVNGEIKDLFIDDSGRFTASLDGGRTIDASGMIVFPGGVDVHTHVAGGAINFARAMTPEDHRRTQAFIRTKSRRSGLGGMAPTTFATGYLYAGMGWTTLNEGVLLSIRNANVKPGLRLGSRESAIMPLMRTGTTTAPPGRF